MVWSLIGCKHCRIDIGLALRRVELTIERAMTIGGDTWKEMQREPDDKSGSELAATACDIDFVHLATWLGLRVGRAGQAKGLVCQ